VKVAKFRSKVPIFEAPLLLSCIRSIRGRNLVGGLVQDRRLLGQVSTVGQRATQNPSFAELDELREVRNMLQTVLFPRHFDKS